MHISSPQPPHLTPGVKRSFYSQFGVLLCLILVLFTSTLDFMVLMPLGPRLMSLFHISPQEFSFLVSIYSFTAGICGFVGSFFLDRLDRKKTLIWIYSGFIISTFFCAISKNYVPLLIARSLSGAFGGVLSGICYAIVGELFSMKERGRATGKLLTAYAFASIIGVPSGLYFADLYGWPATFGFIVLLSALTLFLISRIIPAVDWQLDRRPGQLWAGFIENIRDPNARAALFTTFFMVQSQFVVIPFISAYVVANTGYPAHDLPHIYLIGGGVTVLSGIIMGRICDRFGSKRVFRRTGLLFLIPIYALTHLGHAPIALTLTLTTAIFLLSNFRSVPAMTLITSSIPATRRGSFMSLNACVHQLGAATSTFVAGWVLTQTGDQTEITGFAFTAYLAIAFGLLAYFFGRRIKMVS
jgi:predicted MFS family arabinose efflux permease